MKVQLQYIEGQGRIKRVKAYKSENDRLIFIGSYEGSINKIIEKISKEFLENVTLEKSIFQGWY